MPAKKPANELTAIDGVELDLIQEWLANGRAEALPAEVEQYLNHMEVARSQMVPFQSPNAESKIDKFKFIGR